MCNSPGRRWAPVACLLLVQLAPAARAQTAAPAGPPIPVAVLAVPFPIVEARDAQVPVVVEIGGPQLVAGSGDKVSGEIRGAALDAAGMVVEQFTQLFVLDPGDETLQRTGLKLFAQFRLSPGDYRLRVEVTNADSGARGHWDGALRVPDFAAGEVALSPPLFPDIPNRWRVFRQSDSAHEALPYPFQGAGGDSFLPAVAPRVGTDGGGFHVFLYGATGLPQRFEGRLIAAGGEALRVPLEVVAMASGAFPWERRLALQLAPGARPSGPHRLEVTIGGTWGSGTTRVPVEMVAEALGAPVPLGVAAPAPEPAAAAAEEEPAVLPRNWRPDELAARYRDLLVRGAEEGFESVARELAETELSATTGRKPGQAKALREVEQRVVGQVASAGGDGLLPIIYLHYLADLHLIVRGESWMAAQNRQWARDLVLQWLEHSPDDNSRRLGAQLLAAMGSSGYALELDENNELALVRQAMLAEKGGRYEDSIVWLERLLEAHPRSPQGRLRQAVVTARTGDRERAAKALAALIEDPALPSWMTVLAYQQRAEIERLERRQANAEALLRQGIERLGAQELYLQLAYYLDSWQRGDDAVVVLNRMPAAGTTSSARHLYNAAPTEEVAAARRQVEERLAGGVSRLRVALGAPATNHAGSQR